MNPSAVAVLFLACTVSGAVIRHDWNAPHFGYQPAGLPLASRTMIGAPMTSSQYHAQDELGQASYGYAHPGQAAVNTRDAYGNMAGSWAYINPEGKEVRVSYVADSMGFRVLSNDLPVAPSASLIAPMPVQETAEVAAARAAHMAARSGMLVPAAAPVLSMPVQDTPEVAAAKAAHFAAHHQASLMAVDVAPVSVVRAEPVHPMPIHAGVRQMLADTPSLAAAKSEYHRLKGFSSRLF